MHDLNAAAQHADRVVLLKEGRILADGAVDEVMTAERLADAFDADIEVAELPGGRRCFLGHAEIST
jgi:iron complex transport system ATP-binding protein